MPSARYREQVEHARTVDCAAVLQYAKGRLAQPRTARPRAIPAGTRSLRPFAVPPAITRMRTPLCCTWRCWQNTIGGARIGCLGAGASEASDPRSSRASARPLSPEQRRARAGDAVRRAGRADLRSGARRRRGGDVRSVGRVRSPPAPGQPDRGDARRRPERRSGAGHRACRARGASGVVIVMGDLPNLLPSDVERTVAALPSAAWCWSRHATAPGRTSSRHALRTSCRPPASARAASRIIGRHGGTRHRVLLLLRGAALDVDTTDDLELLVRDGAAGAATRHVLADLAPATRRSAPPRGRRAPARSGETYFFCSIGLPQHRRSPEPACVTMNCARTACRCRSFRAGWACDLLEWNDGRSLSPDAAPRANPLGGRGRPASAARGNSRCLRPRSAVDCSST